MAVKMNFFSSVRSKNYLTAPIVWVMVLVGFLFFFRLGERPFRNPDEGRYAEIAREMVSSADWVKPTLFGLGYLRKPPFFYWLVAGSFQLLGESEFSARAVPAFFGLLGVFLTYWFGCRFFDRERALYAALILGTNFWYVQVARYLVIDAVYSFFLTAALFLFYAAVQSTENKNFFIFMFFGSLACAFLTKGPSALAIVGFPTLIYLVWQKRWKVLMGFSWWVGAGLFFLAVLPWFFLMATRDTEFLRFFFLHEHVQRFVSSDFEHQEGWFYYWILFPLLFAPWSFYRQTWVTSEKKEVRCFLWLTFLVIIVFFSMSRSKLPTYIMPCFPIAALLAADSWKCWMEAKAIHLSDFLPVIVMAFAGTAVIIGAPIFLQTHPGKYPAGLASDLRFLGAVLLAGSVFSARSLKRGQPQRFFFSLIFLMSALALCVPRVMETMNPAYSTRSFADKLRSHGNGSEPIFIYDHPGPFYDFIFYLKRPVKLVGLEGEFVHFRHDSNAKEVSISREEFFSRLKEKKPLVAIMRKSDFLEMNEALRAGVHILKEDNRKVLIQSGPAAEVVI
jgi:4-amino-4-deoxy-L-arabinose transferase-like glycosyltransferase